jgi:hypothetical protein
MKAAATRTFQYWLEEVCARPEAATSDRGIMRAALWHTLCNADRVWRKAGKWPTVEESSAAKTAMLDALAAYAALHDPVKKLYQRLPKGHAMMHIAMGDFGVNPRRTQCYKDEDQVGRCKRLYQGCHANSAPNRSLVRYIVVQGLRWTQEIRMLRLRACGVDF